jgi:hypothetical protein
MGVFRAAQKLQAFFKAGAFSLGEGPLAFVVEHFDPRETLYYTRNDRKSAYHRVFGYGRGLDLQANFAFHDGFTHFVHLIANYERQSLAAVRQHGLELRDNLFLASYGQIHVLRIELLELLEVALRAFDSLPVQQALGVDTRWAVIHAALVEEWKPGAPARQPMAAAGRVILGWLAQPGVLSQTGEPFEAAVRSLMPYAREWLKGAEALRIARCQGQVPLLRLPSFNDDPVIPPPRRPIK